MTATPVAVAAGAEQQETPASTPDWRALLRHLPFTLAAVAFFIWFTSLPAGWLLRYSGLDPFDTAIFDQGIWLLAHFHTPYVSIIGRNLLGDHTSFVMAALIPLYRAFPSAVTLQVAQGLLVTLAAVPVYLLAVKRLRSAPLAACLAGSFYLNASIEGATVSSFHPEAFLLLFVTVALYAAVESKRWLLVVAVGGALLCKEDVAAFTVPLGLWVAWKRDRRLGAAIVAMSAAYAAAMFTVVIPSLLGAATKYGNRIPYGGFAGTVKEALTRPVSFARFMISGSRPGYVWALGACWGWLFVLAPEIAVLAVGPVAENLLSLQSAQRQLGAWYSMSTDGVLAVAAVLAVAKIGRPVLRRAAVAAVTGSAAVTCVLWGWAPFSMSTAPVLASGEVARIEAVQAKLPAGASVSTIGAFLPHVDHRDRVYEYPIPFYDYLFAGPSGTYGVGAKRGAALPFQVEYVFIPTRLVAGEFGGLWSKVAPRYRLVARSGNVDLWKLRAGQ